VTDERPPTLDYRRPNPPWPGHRRLGVFVGIAAATLAIAAVTIDLLDGPVGSRPSSDRAICCSNEHQIGLAILLYQQDHAGHYPDSLAAILSAEEIGPAVFVCPDSNDTAAVLPPPPPGQDRPTTRQVAAALVVPGHVSYVYCGHADWTDAVVPADAIILYEPPANHGGTGSNVLFGDGHAEFVPMPRAGRLIAATAATSRPVSAASVP